MKKRLLVMTLALALFSYMGCINTNAASMGFTLKYLKGAPSTDCVTSWSRSVTTTQSTMSGTISSITSGSQAHVYASNGFSMYFISTGTKSSSGYAIGQKITISSTISKKASSAQTYITGSFGY